MNALLAVALLGATIPLPAVGTEQSLFQWTEDIPTPPLPLVPIDETWDFGGLGLEHQGGPFGLHWRGATDAGNGSQTQGTITYLDKFGATLAEHPLSRDEDLAGFNSLTATNDPIVPESVVYGFRLQSPAFPGVATTINSPLLKLGVDRPSVLKVVPEPSTLAMLCCMLVLVVLYCRRLQLWKTTND